MKHAITLRPASYIRARCRYAISIRGVIMATASTEAPLLRWLSYGTWPGGVVVPLEAKAQ
jgi:hypothetical protein